MLDWRLKTKRSYCPKPRQSGTAGRLTLRLSMVTDSVLERTDFIKMN